MSPPTSRSPAWRRNSAVAVVAGSKLKAANEDVEVFGRRRAIADCEMSPQAQAMIRLALSLALATSISHAALAAKSTEHKPRMADVVALERAVRLPKGAESIRAYARYYSLSDEDGHSILVGDYLLQAPDPPGRYLRPVPGQMQDGGCSVVRVRFDLTKRRVLGALCNGLA